MVMMLFLTRRVHLLSGTITLLTHLGDRLHLTIYSLTRKMAKRKQGTTQAVVDRKKNKADVQVSTTIRGGIPAD